MNPATWRTVFLTAVCVAVLWLAYDARAVVTPLLLALLLAYILDPIVRFLQRRGLSRGAASASVVLVALAALVAVIGAAATQLTREAGAFYKDVAGEPSAPVESRAELERALPAAELTLLREAEWEHRRIVYADRDGDGKYAPGYAAQALAKVRDVLRGSALEKSFGKGLDGLAQFGPKVAESAGTFLSGLVKTGEAVMSGIFGLLTITILFPIYLYYSLVSLSNVYEVVVRHLPESQRARIVDILQQIHVTISAFFRGRLITMAAKGALLLVLYFAFGVPFAFVCAAFAAVASLVPLVGTLASLGPPVVLSLPESSGSTITALVIGVIVVEGIEGYLLIPKLVGSSVGLHSLTVLVCTLVAADLMGVFGMVVAVPLTAVLKILAVEFVLPEVRRRAGLPPRGPPDAVA